MSVVAIKKTKSGFEIAADDICVSGWTVTSNADNQSFSKIENINGMIIGASGYSKDACMIFMYAKTHLLKSNDQDGAFEWFKSFYDWKKERTGSYDAGDSDYLLVTKGRAYYFHNFLCVEIKDNFAIGAGRDFALAALALGSKTKEAVKVACKLSALCSEPIHFYKSEKES